MQSTTVEGDQTEAVNYEEKGRLGEGKKQIFSLKYGHTLNWFNAENFKPVISKTFTQARIIIHVSL